MEVCGAPQSTPVTPQMPSLSAAPSPAASLPTSPPVAPGSAGLPVQPAHAGRGQQANDPAVFQLTDRQVRGGTGSDDVPLYVMCRRWVQNCIDADSGPRPSLQEDSSVRLPSPLPRSDEALKDPPKEVALLQDEETLFLDEDTLPAELLMEHHKEHWVAVRGWHQANMQRELKRWERRLSTLLPAYPVLPSPQAAAPSAVHMSSGPS